MSFARPHVRHVQTSLGSWQPCSASQQSWRACVSLPAQIRDMLSFDRRCVLKKKRALAAGGGNRICLHSLRGSGISAPSAHSLFLQTCTYRAKRIRILTRVKGSGLNAGAAQVALLLIYGLVAACPIAS